MTGEKGVTIVTATNRPSFIKNVFRNYDRQKWEVKELIIVLNNDRMCVDDYIKAAERMKQVTIYQLPEQATLGQCLNVGIRMAKYDYIAKFDDDDYYSPFYLTEGMRKFKRTGADIVGKHRFFMYFKRSQGLWLANMPGRHQVAGGTLMFKRNIYPHVAFANLRQGTDTRFLKDSLRKGYQVQSTSAYHYATVRRPDQSTHTWKVTSRTIRLLRARKITRTRRFRDWVSRGMQAKQRR